MKYFSYVCTKILACESPYGYRGVVKAENIDLAKEKVLRYMGSERKKYDLEKYFKIIIC